MCSVGMSFAKALEGMVIYPTCYIGIITTYWVEAPIVTMLTNHFSFVVFVVGSRKKLDLAQSALNMSPEAYNIVPQSWLSW